MITREKFLEAVGHEPENDDLERCNCDKTGTPGHFQCGWDRQNNLPMFMTMGDAGIALRIKLERLRREKQE